MSLTCHRHPEQPVEDDDIKCAVCLSEEADFAREAWRDTEVESLNNR